MPIDVAVSDPVPVFRYGLLCALGRGGIELTTDEDVVSWATSRASGLLLLTVGSDADFELLVRLQRQSTSVIAIVPILSTQAVANVLRAGASNYVSRESSLDAFRAVVEQTLLGSVTVDLRALRATIGSSTNTIRASWRPTDEEVGWLRQLGSGATVAALAAIAGYSERMMFRKLRLLYRRMGVESRTQALMQARDAGLL